MNVKKPVLALALTNIAIILIFAGVRALALADSSSNPVPVYGDWQTINGCAFTGGFWTFANSEYAASSQVHHWNNWSLLAYDYDWPTTSFTPSGDYPNLTCASSTLSLFVNTSKPTMIGLGTFTFSKYAYVSNGTQFFTNYRVEDLTPLLNATFANMTFVNKFRLDAPVWAMNPVPDADVTAPASALWYLGYAAYPCVMWQNQSIDVQLKFSYYETWKYTPIDHFDNSTIEHGRSLLSVLPTYLGSLAISDVLIVAVLGALAWTKKEET